MLDVLIRYLAIKAVAKTVVFLGWVGLLKWSPQTLLSIFNTNKPLAKAVGAWILGLFPEEVEKVKRALDYLSDGVVAVASAIGPLEEAIVRSFGIDGAIAAFETGLATTLAITGYLAYRERRAIRRWFKKGQRIEPKFQ